jgi:hypothetical protein
MCCENSGRASCGLAGKRTCEERFSPCNCTTLRTLTSQRCFFPDDGTLRSGCLCIARLRADKASPMLLAVQVEQRSEDRSCFLNISRKLLCNIMNRERYGIQSMEDKHALLCFYSTRTSHSMDMEVVIAASSPTVRTLCVANAWDILMTRPDQTCYFPTPKYLVRSETKNNFKRFLARLCVSMNLCEDDFTSRNLGCTSQQF